MMRRQPGKGEPARVDREQVAIPPFRRAFERTIMQCRVYRDADRDAERYGVSRKEKFD